MAEETNLPEKTQEEQVALLLNQLDNKDFAFYFFTLDTLGNPVAGVANIYEHVKTLNDLGYKAGQPDGYLGFKTMNALRNFQKDKGLKQTGLLDNQTVKALGIALIAQIDIHYPKKIQSSAEQLRIYLDRRGFNVKLYPFKQRESNETEIRYFRESERCEVNKIREILEKIQVTPKIQKDFQGKNKKGSRHYEILLADNT